MTQQHTPGPWAYDRDNSRIVSQTAFADYSTADDPFPVVVVDVLSSMGGENPIADLHLIAAAPVMLTALEKVRDWLDGYSTREAMRKEVLAAIALATGEEPKA